MVQLRQRNYSYNLSKKCILSNKQRVTSLSSIFFLVLGPDLKLHPGVRSSRNSMKVLTARTDVSYLRDYKTGGEEGYAGRFCAFRVFLFFSNPASPLSQVHSLCLSVGYAGLPLVLRV